MNQISCTFPSIRNRHVTDLTSSIFPRHWAENFEHIKTKIFVCATARFPTIDLLRIVVQTGLAPSVPKVPLYNSCAADRAARFHTSRDTLDCLRPGSSSSCSERLRTVWPPARKFPDTQLANFPRKKDLEQLTGGPN